LTALIALVVLLASGLSHAQGSPAPAGPGQGEVAGDGDGDDAAMKAAFAKARATLERFLALARKPPAGARSFSVKVAVRDGPRVEYLWVTPFAPQGDGFTGEIGQTPEQVSNVKEGQQIRFGRSEIVDWMYVDSTANKMHGNYTTCALLTQAPADEAESMKRDYGLDCATN
jgi:uncharacterized protein YegJ (DUF2314 family)